MQETLCLLEVSAENLVLIVACLILVYPFNRFQATAFSGTSTDLQASEFVFSVFIPCPVFLICDEGTFPVLYALKLSYRK
jgi:hypothetical protein